MNDPDNQCDVAQSGAGKVNVFSIVCAIIAGLVATAACCSPSPIEQLIWLFPIAIGCFVITTWILRMGSVKTLGKPARRVIVCLVDAGIVAALILVQYIRFQLGWTG